MRPQGRRALAVAALLIVLGAGVALWLARLRLAQALVLRAVAAAGVAGAEVAVAEVGPRGALLGRLRVGAGPEADLEVERIALRYSLLGLLRGRVAEVAIGGLRLRGRAGEAGVSFESLDALRGRPRATEAAGGAAALPPVDALVLHDARVELATAAGPASLRVDGDLDLGGPDVAGEALLRAEHARGRGQLSLALSGDAREPVVGVVDGRFALEGPGAGPLVLEGIEGELTFGEGGPQGRLAVGAIGSEGVTPLALAVRLAPSGAAPAGAGEIPLALEVSAAGGRAKLSGDGRLRLDPPGAEVSLAGAFELAPGALQPADLAPRLGALVAAAEGRVAVRATLRAGADGFSLAGRCESQGVDLATPGGLVVLGLAGAADFEGPAPFRTPRIETLRFRRADVIGPFEDGEVRFRLRGAELEVSEASWRYAGGRLSTSERFDLAAEEHPFTVRVQGVSLEQLLEQVGVPDLSGTGSLSGSLPLVYDGVRLRVHEGTLAAAPPGGVVRYAPASAAEGSLGLGGDVDVLAGALQDFHYDTLRLSLSGALDGEVHVGVALYGKNPRYERGRRVELNVNVETNLPALLRAGRSVTGVPDVIERRLRGRVSPDGS